jgi:HAD superfamily hydrolase (TIGR01509 family)
MDSSRDRLPSLPIVDVTRRSARVSDPGSARVSDPAGKVWHGQETGHNHGRVRLPGQIRGVLFDMGNVLYDDTVWRRWVLQLLSHLGLHTNYRCFFRVWDRDYLGDVHCGRREFREAFEAFLLSAGLTRSQIDEVEAACRARRHQLDQGARPLPGVKPTLERLHQSGLTLGVLSNSEHAASVLRGRLRRFAVGDLITTVVSSIDLKRTMPDPACYLTALKAMKLPAEQVAFVGHDTAELAGAAAVGMPTIAFNFDADAQADVYLARFDELPDAVGPPPPLAAAG